jgi:hypothetical protein
MVASTRMRRRLHLLAMQACEFGGPRACQRCAAICGFFAVPSLAQAAGGALASRLDVDGIIRSARDEEGDEATSYSPRAGGIATPLNLGQR